jgi:hypothetical protein
MDWLLLLLLLLMGSIPSTVFVRDTPFLFIYQYRANGKHCNNDKKRTNKKMDHGGAAAGHMGVVWGVRPSHPDHG